MQGVRELGNALVIALISISLMIGALSVSLVEFVPEAPTATYEVIPSPVLLTATNTPLPTLTPTRSLESPTVTVTATFVNTATPPISCPPPFGWVTQIFIQAGDTLDSIALSYRVSKDDLRRANCLPSDNLIIGTILYVPPAPTSTVPACTPGGPGWLKSYMIKPGDTLYAIATNYYITVDVLKRANCRTSDLIYAGEILWVPNVATRTPFPTPVPGTTITPYPTTPLTQTVLPYTVTATATSTPVPATLTTAPTQTAASTLTASPTAFPTFTPIPTAIPTFTESPTTIPTLTVSPTAFPTP